MRILYIAADNPAVDTILGGMHTETLGGLPAFYYPFKMLLDRGHTIDLLLYTPEEKTVVESEHFKVDNLIQIHPKNGVLPGAVEYALQLSGTVRKLLNERKYDFVYGMSEGAHLAVREAAKRGISCGLRQFGVQEMVSALEAIPNLTARRLKALKDYTYITLSLLSKKNFILATNDSSQADRLFSLLQNKKRKYEFYHWRTGVMIPPERTDPEKVLNRSYPDTYDTLALSHIGRVVEIKRQDRSVCILGELHKHGYPFHLYLVGEVRDEQMRDQIIQSARSYGVEEYVHFAGGQNQSMCRQYARNSFATLLTGDINLGNVFYEVVSEGSLLLTNNNHSLDDFMEADRNCVMYEPENAVQAAEKLIALLEDPKRVTAIRTEAYRTATERFLSIEKRFQMEVNLIEDTVNGKDTSGYPAEI